MTALLIDNYDSFTYNLFQLWTSVSGVPPVVLRNDDWDGWESLDPGAFEAVVISPGPGRPDRIGDFGVSRLALSGSIPVLGVCLGHQGLCLAEGATVARAREPVHGRASAVRHRGTGLFMGIPSPFQAVRYHSLIVTDVPPSLEVTATTIDPVTGAELVMAVAHRTKRQWGVQFHPESIGTEHGEQLLRNFHHLAAAADRPGRPHDRDPITLMDAPAARNTRPAAADNCAAPGTVAHSLRLVTRRLPFHPSGPALFSRLFAGRTHSYWLDSSAPSPGSRFSILGSSGPLGEWVTAEAGSGSVRCESADGSISHTPGDLFGYLDRQLARRSLPAPGLPFDFALGYVGFLGYELKADTGGDRAHTSDLPDSALLFSDQAVVIDHEARQTWLLSLTDDATEAEALRWLEAAAGAVELAARSDPSAVPSAAARAPAHSPPARQDDSRQLTVTYRHDPQRYQLLVDECLEQIRAGESYEICLTNTLTVDARADPLTTWLELRTINPSPYAALLVSPQASVLSSSPERFLRITGDGRVQAKPIKGTQPRGGTSALDAALAFDLASSEKDRSEHLMIVDLVRNDLGRVAQTGSVEVTKLFDVETYATVHQLVSTIEARLAPGRTAVDCVRAAFPGGSMTGAPKRRTMQIIDRLEAGPRGVYSGALGYFSLSGAVDLSIVIRTLVVYPGHVTLGVGGAVVALSDPAAEVDEMLLKAQAPLEALRRSLATGSS